MNDDGASKPEVSPSHPACAQGHRAGSCSRSHCDLFICILCSLPPLPVRIGSHLNLAMRTWYIPLALYHLPPAGFPPVILAAWWESLQAWASLRTLQSLTSYRSWQSFSSPRHTPGISSGPGPNPSGPLHGLMDIRLKLWFQLHPLPFCCLLHHFQHVRKQIS